MIYVLTTIINLVIEVKKTQISFNNIITNSRDGQPMAVQDLNSNLI